MADDTEEGFTVRDRRGSSSTATPPAPRVPEPTEIIAAADSAPAFGDADNEEPDFGSEDGALPDVFSVLALFLGELRNLAWLRMGLLANPGTGEFERDLPQARIAIDTVTFLASQLENAVAPEERLPLKALVSDLQVNFVEQSKRAA